MARNYDIGKRKETSEDVIRNDLEVSYGIVSQESTTETRSQYLFERRRGATSPLVAGTQIMVAGRRHFLSTKSSQVDPPGIT
jgi:hypothetical protein